MRPQFPFKSKYVITQGYAENANNYNGGKHGALDVVPKDEYGMPYPAELYPIFNGSTVSIADTSDTRGKGIKFKVVCDSPFVEYLKSKNVVPKDHTGIVTLEILYWHVLKVLDYDGTVTQDTPVALAGNTGIVYSGGKPVPDDEKGKPPYKGLHLHLETILKSGAKTLNTNLDFRGRIDPMIILNYKPKMNEFAKTMNYKGTVGVFIAADNVENFKFLAKSYGVEAKVKPDGTIETDINIS